MRRPRKAVKKPATTDPVRSESFKKNFRSVKTISKKIRHIALSAIKDHNAIKGTNMYLVRVVEARVMKELIGLLYHLTLHVKQPTKDSIIFEKMVWVGESRESIVCYEPRLHYLIDFDEDYQFDFDFKQPFPQRRPSSTKTQKLAQFALEEFNEIVGQSYCFKLKDSENVNITLAKWGSQIYPKGAAGYSVFNVYRFDLNKLVENKHIPNNLMVVTKTWLQTLDDEKADSFLYNLSLPRNHPVIERMATQTISEYPLLEVSLTSPTVETKAWFAVEDELFKRNRQLEFVRVVNGSITSCAGDVFTLTIEAWDQGVLKMFDTDVWERKWRGICITSPFEETTTPPDILADS